MRTCGLVPRRVDRHNRGGLLPNEIVSFIEESQDLEAAASAGSPSPAAWSPRRAAGVKDTESIGVLAFETSSKTQNDRVFWRFKLRFRQRNVV